MGSSQNFLHGTEEEVPCSVMPIPFGNTSNSPGKNVQVTTMLEDLNAKWTEEFVKERSPSNGDNYYEKINKLQIYLDTVNKIMKPGCSSELLNVALNFMASVVGTLSMMSSRQYPHSSL